MCVWTRHSVHISAPALVSVRDSYLFLWELVHWVPSLSSTTIASESLSAHLFSCPSWAFKLAILYLWEKFHLILWEMITNFNLLWYYFHSQLVQCHGLLHTQGAFSIYWLHYTYMAWSLCTYSYGVCTWLLSRFWLASSLGRVSRTSWKLRRQCGDPHYSNYPFTQSKLTELCCAHTKRYLASL